LKTKNKALLRPYGATEDKGEIMAEECMGDCFFQCQFKECRFYPREDEDIFELGINNNPGIPIALDKEAMEIAIGKFCPWEALARDNKPLGADKQYIEVDGAVNAPVFIVPATLTKTKRIVGKECPEKEV